MLPDFVIEDLFCIKHAVISTPAATASTYSAWNTIPTSAFPPSPIPTGMNMTTDQPHGQNKMLMEADELIDSSILATPLMVSYNSLSGLYTTPGNMTSSDQGTFTNLRNPPTDGVNSWVEVPSPATNQIASKMDPYGRDRLDGRVPLLPRKRKLSF